MAAIDSGTICAPNGATKPAIQSSTAATSPREGQRRCHERVAVLMENARADVERAQYGATRRMTERVAMGSRFGTQREGTPGHRFSEMGRAKPFACERRGMPQRSAISRR